MLYKIEVSSPTLSCVIYLRRLHREVEPVDGHLGVATETALAVDLAEFPESEDVPVRFPLPHLPLLPLHILIVTRHLWN